jgi:hypothetical protein
VVIDAELDAAEAAGAGRFPAALAVEPAETRAGPATDTGTGTGADTGADTGEPTAGSQPWWESDPRFADRFRSAGDA